MKPPKGLLPTSVGEELLPGHRILDSRGLIVASTYASPNAAFIVYALNTHESTQAELERLNEQAKIFAGATYLAQETARAVLAENARLKKERASIIIALRGIADAVEELNAPRAIGFRVDALLVALGDLATGYTKGGEGEG